jgi:hypothetical protein
MLMQRQRLLMQKHWACSFLISLSNDIYGSKIVKIGSVSGVDEPDLQTQRQLSRIHDVGTFRGKRMRQNVGLLGSYYILLGGLILRVVVGGSGTVHIERGG